MLVASQFSVVAPLTGAFVIYITNASDPGDFWNETLFCNDFFETLKYLTSWNFV